MNVTAVSTYGEIKFEYNESDHHFILYENGTMEFIWSADGIVPSKAFVREKEWEAEKTADDDLPLPAVIGGPYTNVIIYDGYTGISDRAFDYCDKMESISIPDSVTNIGFGAFWDRKSLKRLDSMGRITTLGYIFAECDSLEYVRIPDAVTHLDDHTLIGLTSALKELYIPAGVTYSDLESSDCPRHDGLTIYCRAGSDAERFVQDRGINYAYY